MDELSIIAGVRSFLDEANHCIKDSDIPAAINKLKDARDAIETLQGVLRLPSACRDEIWT